MDDLEASRLTEQRYEQEQQQKHDDEQRQQELVAILKRVDCHTSDHEDVLLLASALGVSEFFNQRKEIDDEYTTHATNERAKV